MFELAHGASAITTLASFTNANGHFPAAGLVADAAGNLYGTTYAGGSANKGTVFELAHGATTITTLASFTAGSGAQPVAGVIEDAAGNFYGTTQQGGSANKGTVFELAHGASTVTTLASFTVDEPSASLIADAADNLYGTTAFGGTAGDGTVFELATGATTVTTLMTFTGANGANPLAGLIADAAGNLYGTTEQGGSADEGTVFELSGYTATAFLGTVVPGFGTDALSVALISDADFATGSSATLSGGNLVYTPGLITAAKAGADVLKYTVTDTVTGAVTTETQTVTLGSGPAPLVTETLVSGPGPVTATAALTGTAEAGGVVVISNGATTLGTAPVSQGGIWSFTPIGLADGSYTLTASETDLAGNVGTASLAFTLDTVPCFCAGTLIRTARGEVAVEELVEDEDVVTASGARRPIRWIGRRSYAGRFIRGNRDVLPICISTGALAENVPARDLWISPLHALFIDGVLIPAGELVNDVPVVQMTHVEQVRYYHVELDSHDVLLAENTPAESFVDDDSRGMFHNAATFHALHPGRAPAARYCAPRVTDGEALAIVRWRLASRAGLGHAGVGGRRIGGRPGELRGFLDHHSPRRIAGWAQDLLHPDVPVCLAITLDGVRLAEILAGGLRPDLVRAGIGDGRHGFDFRPVQPIAVEAMGRIVVTRISDGAALQRTLSVQAAVGRSSVRVA